MHKLNVVIGITEKLNITIKFVTLKKILKKTIKQVHFYIDATIINIYLKSSIYCPSSNRFNFHLMFINYSNFSDIYYLNHKKYISIKFDYTLVTNKNL